MASDDIKPGAIVRLKAGGPNMLVLSRDGVRTQCEIADEGDPFLVRRPHYDARYLELAASDAAVESN